MTYFIFQFPHPFLNRSRIRAGMVSDPLTEWLVPGSGVLVLVPHVDAVAFGSPPPAPQAVAGWAVTTMEVLHPNQVSFFESCNTGLGAAGRQFGGGHLSTPGVFGVESCRNILPHSWAGVSRA